MSERPAQPAPGSRRRRRGRLLLVGTPIAMLLVAATILALTPFANMLGGRVAGNIVPPDTREAAITPFTPPASADEYAALSGRGEGLDCSISSFIEHTAFARPRGGIPVNLRYRQACVAHDLCYRHGAASYGYSQADCDAALARAALRVCRERSARAEDCLGQVRRVYAGLVVGGAGSFRPKRPDLLAAGESKTSDNAIDAACASAKKKGAAPPKLAFAYPAWPEALRARLAQGWWPWSDRRDYRLALGRCYGQLSPSGLTALLASWMHVASTAGEYDPFPLGTGDVSIPRLVRLDGRVATLVFYLQLAGGAELHLFGWKPGSRPGMLVACGGGSGCAGPTFTQAVPQSYRYRPGTPWVARLPKGREGLLWWRRKLTGIDSTGGNLQLLTLSPGSSLLVETMDGPMDPCAADIYPAPAGDARITVAAIDPNDCDAEQSHVRRMQPPLLRVREVGLTGDKLSGGWGRARLHSAGDPSNWLSNPPLIERDIASLGHGLTSQRLPVVRVTAFRRSPSDFRAKIETRSWVVPADFRSHPPLLTRSPEPERGSYDLPEASEPYAPLRGDDKVLRLLTVSCEPGGSAAEHCAHDRDGTRITLWQPAGQRATETIPLAASYHIMRGIVVQRSSHPKLREGSRHTLLLTRLIAKTCGRELCLNAILHRADVDDGALDDRGDIPLGVIFRSSRVGDVLRKASRLFPFVGDVDGDGKPDYILADPAAGVQSLAFTGVLARAYGIQGPS